MHRILFLKCSKELLTTGRPDFFEYKVTDLSFYWGGDLRLHYSPKCWFCPDNAFTSPPLIQLKHNLLFLVRSVLVRSANWCMSPRVPAWQGQQARGAQGKGEELAPSVAMTFQTGLSSLWSCAFHVVTAPFSNRVRCFKLSFDASVSPSPEGNRTSARRVFYSSS